VFSIADPSVITYIWDADQNMDVSGGSVIQSENLTIRVDTNLYSAIDPNFRLNTTAYSGGVWNRADAASRGNDSSAYLDIKVKTDSGNILNKLFTQHTNAAVGTVTLTGVAPTVSPWFTNYAGKNWSTDAYDQNGQYAYPAGSYQVWAESYLNGMYDNYRSGSAAFSTKTVSEVKTVAITSNTVKITANKDSVVRSKAFSVTITGKPNTYYHLWIKDTNTMSGGYDD